MSNTFEGTFFLLISIATRRVHFVGLILNGSRIGLFVGKRQLLTFPQSGGVIFKKKTILI